MPESYPIQTIRQFHQKSADPGPEVLPGAKADNSEAILTDILPGTELRYSGGGYRFLQQLMIDVRRKSFPDLLREKVLEPLRVTLQTER